MLLNSVVKFKLYPEISPKTYIGMDIIIVVTNYIHKLHLFEFTNLQSKY